MADTNINSREYGNQYANLAGKAASSAGDEAIRALLQGRNQQAGLQQSGQNEQKLAQLKELLGQQSSAEDLARAKAANTNPQGIIYSTGTAHAQEPFAKMVLAGPAQAGKFGGVVDKAYKPINDQLDSSKSTLDFLNQKNAASDKLALISEARLAAGTGGSRAIKGIMDSLSGGKTANMDVQGAINFFNNTPNIPTMQESQRNAIRESIYGRMDTLGQQQDQITKQLSVLGAQQAPSSDYNGIIGAYSSGVSQKMSQLQKMRSDYQSGLQSQGGSLASNPSQSDPGQSNIGKVQSLLSPKPAQTAPVSPTATPQLQMPSMQDFMKFKASPAYQQWKTQQNQAPQQPQSGVGGQNGQ